MTKKYKEKRIRLYLLSGKSLTPNQALRKFKCSRLASVIHKMRVDGIKVHTELTTEGGDTFATYSVIKQKKENRIKTLYS